MDMTTKDTLWRNVTALMEHHWGKEHLARLHRESKLSLGTISRLKERNTSTGLEVLEAIAGCFHLEPWQLLVPGLDPKSPPTLQPMTAQERELYRRLEALMAEMKRQN